MSGPRSKIRRLADELLIELINIRINGTEKMVQEGTAQALLSVEEELDRFFAERSCTLPPESEIMSAYQIDTMLGREVGG